MKIFYWLNIDAYKELWPYISESRRRQLLGLFCLMFLSAIVEAVSLGAVVPFLGAITNINELQKSNYYLPIMKFFNASGERQQLYLITSFFVISIVFSTIIRIVFIWSNTKFSYDIGAELGIEMYKKTLYQPYIKHAERNSSEIMSGILTKAGSIVSGLLYPMVNIAASLIMVLAILVMICLIQPQVAIMAVFCLGTLYLFISKISKKIIKKNSEVLAKKSISVYKMLQEGMGGIREIIIDDNQAHFIKLFGQEFKAYYDACAEVQIVSLGPRYIVEMFGIIFIAFFSMQLVLDEAGQTNVIPIFGALALCAQRLLPLIQQIYSSIVSIGTYRTSIEDAIGLLNQKLNARKCFEVQLNDIKMINLKDVYFRYNNEDEYILKNINLDIKVGDKVGVIGTTGGGKSTLIDLILGLLNPTAGTVEINGLRMSPLNAYEFQSKITHVPQSIYLKDATIAENIAFGENPDQINIERVKKCIEIAQLQEMVDAIPLGINATVGERGIKFSGGELQRIGIARALYKPSAVLVLDEATSALDENTETLIISSMEKIFMNGILIMISHRPKTLNICNKIIKIENNNLFLVRNE